MSDDTEGKIKRKFLAKMTVVLCFIKIEHYFGNKVSNVLTPKEWIDLTRGFINWNLDARIGEEDYRKILGKLGCDIDKPENNEFCTSLNEFFEGENQIDILGACTTPGEFDIMLVVNVRSLEPMTRFVIEIIRGETLGPSVSDTQLIMTLPFAINDALFDALRK